MTMTTTATKNTKTQSRFQDRPEKRKLTEMPGNPANALMASYRELMTIQDPQELHDRAVQIVQECHGNGMSTKNYHSFLATISGFTLETNKRRALERMQSYVTNFLLAADGLRVLGNSGGR